MPYDYPDPRPAWFPDQLYENSRMELRIENSGEMHVGDLIRVGLYWVGEPLHVYGGRDVPPGREADSPGALGIVGGGIGMRIDPSMLRFIDYNTEGGMPLNWGLPVVSRVYPYNQLNQGGSVRNDGDFQIIGTAPLVRWKRMYDAIHGQHLYVGGNYGKPEFCPSPDGRLMLTLLFRALAEGPTMLVPIVGRTYTKQVEMMVYNAEHPDGKMQTVDRLFTENADCNMWYSNGRPSQFPLEISPPAVTTITIGQVAPPAPPTPPPPEGEDVLASPVQAMQDMLAMVQGYGIQHDIVDAGAFRMLLSELEQRVIDFLDAADEEG